MQRDLRFRDLGLVVLDEEQRFGVAQKEKLKQLRTEVDVVAMSATPIPRTLNFSLMGARDLSVIETPPKNRLPKRKSTKRSLARPALTATSAKTARSAASASTKTPSVSPTPPTAFVQRRRRAPERKN